MDYFNKGEGEKQAAFAAKRDLILRPLIRYLAAKGVTPTAISFVGVFFAAFAVAMPASLWEFSAAGFILYVLMDGLDGPLARWTKAESEAGSLVDIFADQFGVVLVALAAILWLDADILANVLFAFFYSHTVYLMVICNLFSLRMPYVIRVKYLYFIVYISSLYFETSQPVNLFAMVFLAYYLVYFALLFRIILKRDR
ncbi:CDP-alcohol phosphatidyltransferase family protein [uncultured Cohaesibacter sp.]|uniref:CDP-alcohol phosphatidyltransferase family protein n=1 Tax=uncultured Cohaesibacter sp. TaxID=1002546 RepID=UPI0029C96DF8|nr:CDP-alcohol phosphatidyltransferase family protein [uncultured Cohaesibacter sp.]